MDPSGQALITQLDIVGLGPQVEEYIRVFEGEINVLVTLTLHLDVFQDLVDYFHAHVDPYTIQFDESERIWVPINYLKVIFGRDNNFCTRLNRFM